MAEHFSDVIEYGEQIQEANADCGCPCHDIHKDTALAQWVKAQPQACQDADCFPNDHRH